MYRPTLLAHVECVASVEIYCACGALESVAEFYSAARLDLNQFHFRSTPNVIATTAVASASTISHFADLVTHAACALQDRAAQERGVWSRGVPVLYRST